MLVKRKDLDVSTDVITAVFFSKCMLQKAILFFVNYPYLKPDPHSELVQRRREPRKLGRISNIKSCKDQQCQEDRLQRDSLTPE